MARMAIHPTAIIDDRARLAPDVEVGPFCIVEGEVVLGEGVRMISHARLQGPLEIGEGTIVYPFACVGMGPQDLKISEGDPTAGVRIGARCRIREHATIHAATSTDRPTSLGDDVFMMQNAHVGHDGQVGDHVILTNGVLLAGHTQVEERAILSGNASVHQFGRIGRLAFVSGLTAVAMDVLPYCIARSRNRIAAINVIGMRRAGIPSEHIVATREAYREVLRRTMSQEETIAALSERARHCPPLAHMADFIRQSKRGVAAAERGLRGDQEAID